jgi:phage-related minor tail protein
MGTSTIHFRAMSEDTPSHKWLARAQHFWPAYERWYGWGGLTRRPSYLACRRAMRTHMPELVPMYEKLTEMLGDIKMQLSGVANDIEHLKTEASEIKAEAKKTNGRITRLEIWQAKIAGATAAVRWLPGFVTAVVGGSVGVALTYFLA